MKPEPAGDTDQAQEVARIAALSDGVFAIAMTLIVFQLEVPKGPKVDLDASLLDLLPDVMTFVISFLVIGTYWVAHHRLFALVRRYDLTFIWLNLLTLFCIVLLPFTSSLVGEHTREPLGVAVYAASVAAAGLANTLLVRYALHGHRLCAADLPAGIARYYFWRGLVVALVFLVSLVLLPLGTTVVTLSWLTIPVAQYLVRRRFDPGGAA